MSELNDANSMSNFLSIDAGGTYFKSALVGQDANLRKGSFHQEPVSSAGTKAEVIQAYEKIIFKALEYAKKHGSDISGVGVSTPGPFDYEHGISLMTHKFQAMKDISIRDEIDALGILQRDVPVVFMQDVHAFLTGEHWAGAAKGFKNPAAITLGTGLGFSVMNDGVILDNSHGGPGTIIFNRPYSDGILEDVVSRRGIISLFRKYANSAESNIDVHDIAVLARENNDANAARVFREVGEILGGELADTLKKQKIEAIVFGGQISKSFDLFGPAFQQRLKELNINIKALQGNNIDFSALLGVAKKLKQSIIRETLKKDKTMKQKIMLRNQ